LEIAEESWDVGKDDAGACVDPTRRRRSVLSARGWGSANGDDGEWFRTRDNTWTSTMQFLFVAAD
jgi:hypothetical protein